MNEYDRAAMVKKAGGWGEVLGRVAFATLFIFGIFSVLHRCEKEEKKEQAARFDSLVYCITSAQQDGERDPYDIARTCQTLGVIK